MTDKADKIFSKLRDDLNNYTSFEDKNAYLKNHKYLDRIYEKYPDLQKEVNSLMIETISAEFGVPESQQFSFSKDISDKELFRTIQMFEANKKVIETEFGDKESIAEFRALSKEKKLEFDEVDRKKEIHRDNIAQLREEFDDRVGAFESGNPLRILPPLPEITKYFMQGLVGWTDWFRPEGMEKIENRSLNWDPKYERFGPSTEIMAEQRHLQGVLNEEASLKKKYKGMSEKVTEFNELEESQKKRVETIKNSGIDEALNYIGMDEIKLLLRK